MEQRKQQNVALKATTQSSLQREAESPRHVDAVLRRLKSDVLPAIGSLCMTEVEGSTREPSSN